MLLRQGQMLDGKYMIQSLISTGGFSEVYRATHMGLNRDVAIKLFSSGTYFDVYKCEQISQDMVYCDICQNEIDIMKQIKHQYLPQLYDIIKIGNLSAIVMEYIDGDDMLERVKTSGPLSYDSAVEYFLQMCEATSYLHNYSPPILHCDIKPNNIIIQRDKGQICLLDLGLSRIVADKSNVHALGRTDGYSPPEFFTAEYYQQLNSNFYFWKCTTIAYFPSTSRGTSRIQNIDRTSDVYSLGATLYYMLTGVHPRYENTDFSRVAHRKIRDIIEHSMRKNPSERFDCVEELMRGIRNLKYDYDVALSFAGEDREYVMQVARILKEHSVRVFYDGYEQANLWGKDLYLALDDVYKRKSKYCVMFISRHYRDKVWTVHERRSAFERALRADEDYILPARFDNTEIPGVRTTTAYIDLRKTAPSELADLLIRKLALHNADE